MVSGAKGDAEHFCGGEQYLMPALDDFFENMKDTTAENKCDCITDDADISALLNICILEIFFFGILKLNWKKQLDRPSS